VIATPIREVWTVLEDEAGLRLDRFLQVHTEEHVTRSQLTRAIDQGAVTINGETAPKAGARMRTGDVVATDIKATIVPDLQPENIPVDVLHLDDDLIVVVKPAGLVVHPGPGHPSGTLVNALLHLLPQTADGHLRPGIVHRLDKDTSGVMVVARSPRALACLARQFAEHSSHRAYQAIVVGKHLADTGTFDTLHGRHPKDRKRFSAHADRGRRAVTHYEVLERFLTASLVRCRLETGRTHQIRMHLAEAGAPVVGDEMYGGKRALSHHIQRQALHACTLGFEHPSGEWLDFESTPPEDFTRTLTALRSGKEYR
jgi:23S rRNA pseudouridine1911/1915/1917 synthase